MSNPLSKLQSHQLPGDLFTSAVSEVDLIIESRINEVTYLTHFDISTGKVLSENKIVELTPWHTLVGLADQHPVIQHFENRKNPDQVSHYLYNFQSAKLDLAPAEISYATTNIQSPRLYMQESTDFYLFKQLIDENLVLACEYMEVKKKLIIGYYLLNKSGYTRRLRILADGKNVYDEVQDEAMKGFAPGSFFTLKNRLIFARNKREINIYEI